jgi:hypothetical protein
MLVVLDDLHAAAKPALMLLRHVLRGLDGSRLLLVATYRDTELGRTGSLADTLADLRGVRGVERVSLSGLDVQGLGALLDHPAESALTLAVFAETEGNPFFAREVLRDLQESGALVRREGRWVADGPIANLGIPEGVREVIGRRLGWDESQLENLGRREEKAIRGVVVSEAKPPTLERNLVGEDGLARRSRCERRANPARQAWQNRSSRRQRDSGRI